MPWQQTNLAPSRVLTNIAGAITATASIVSETDEALNRLGALSVEFSLPTTVSSAESDASQRANLEAILKEHGHWLMVHPFLQGVGTGALYPALSAPNAVVALAENIELASERLGDVKSFLIILINGSSLKDLNSRVSDWLAVLPLPELVGINQRLTLLTQLEQSKLQLPTDDMKSGLAPGTAEGTGLFHRELG